METSTQDRLKAFLDRNRNRNTNSKSEKEDDLDVPTVSTPTKSANRAIAFQFADGLAPLSSRSPLYKDPNAIHEEPTTPDLFTPAFEKRVTYADDDNTAQVNSPTMNNGLNFSLGNERRKSSGFSLGSPASFAQKEAPKEITLSMRCETEDNRANYTTSQTREGKTAGRNMIESYITQKKNAEKKLRNTVRNNSKESKFVTPKKSNVMFSTFNSNTPANLSTRSEVLDTQGSMSARTTRKPKFSSRDFSQSEVKQKAPKQTKPQKQLNSTLLSSSAKKPKEERREFIFEEAPNGPRGNQTSRSVSKSKDPVRPTSLTPRGLRSHEKRLSGVPQQIAQQQRPEKASDKSRISTPKNQQKEFFPESSRRLQMLDTSANSEAKFKKEIKSLIQIIKQEKEQITEDLQSMSKELSKYKTAYKQLKKQLDVQAKDFAEKVKNPQSRSEQYSEGSGSHPGNTSDHIANQENKSPQKNSRSIEDSTPFTIEELTNHLDKNIPNIAEEGHAELLSKMKHINSDVESIVARAKQDFSLNKENTVTRSLELQSFQLRKNAVNCYIIKEMNLASHIFFQDNIKEKEEDLEFKPTVIDLLSAQREIIHFLIRKLEVEEKQRLKTEEQASMMIAQVEKSLKQMDERGPGSRKRESNCNTEENKSINSQS